MIVFTATSVHSEQVYVGTARESVEEEWASLTSQAEAGASGEFFHLLRNHGVAGFTVEVWAFADSPGEARESMREARDELGAEAIRSSRSAAAPAVPKTKSKSSADAVKALLASLADDDGPVDEDALFEAADWRSSASGDVAADAGQATASPVSATPAATSSQSSVALAAGTATAEAEGDDEEARLQQRISMMKEAQARLLQEREARRGGGNSPAAPAPRSTPERLPDGRASSSSKEKRIREAIAEERERRDNQNQRRTQEQYAEMRDVLARIELRRIQTRRENTEKAKVARSRQVQADRRQQQAEKERQQELRQKVLEASSPAAETEIPEVQGSAADRARAIARDIQSRGKQVAAAPVPAEPTTPAAPGAESPATARRAVKGGSAAREKRIREAIAEEKAAREMRHSQRRAAEADEMAEILGRLDERSKAAEKYKRRL
ncbi:hypothetical protein [Pseudomaricurvus sp. HS19]|uniref:hypothetical protein n=1 Tax=Pseudomaricurvus sp. HS19 TaxID=2692626 RepID=UPI00136C03AC|nr:hypothetical protein [Pseudomaricurvus sp. HS19]MYM64669.1 hypothetical protein [Pseudomaricurvus sp. HS19]